MHDVRDMLAKTINRVQTTFMHVKHESQDRIMLLVGRKKIERHLDLSWNTVRKLHYTEGLPLVRLGGQWAVDTRQLAEWLSRKSQPCQGVRQ